MTGRGRRGVLRAALPLAVPLATALILVAGATTTGAVGATPAPGGDLHGRISQIGSAHEGMRLLFSVDGLPEGAVVDPGSVAVRIDDQRVASDAAPVQRGGGAAPAVQRSALLVLDTSGSMTGASLAGAKTAAAAFLDSAPTDVRVGLLTFASTVQLVVPPTTDRAALTRAVTGLKANGETRLYDAVLRGLRVLGSGGDRTIVLLSDGKDEGSRASLTGATSQLERAGVAVHVVSLGVDRAQAAQLDALARAARGRVVSAGQAAQLATAFEQAARTLATQLVVTVTVPAELAGRSASIRVAAEAVEGADRIPVSGEAFATVPTASGATRPSDDPYGPRPAPVSAAASWLNGSTFPVIVLILFLGVAGLLALLALAATGRDSRASRLSRRLSAYTVDGRRALVTDEPQEGAFGSSSALARSSVRFVERFTRRRGVEERLTSRLEAAGVPLKPAEWILVHGGAAVVLPLLGLAVSAGRWPVVLLGLLVGAGGPWIYLRVAESRRRAAFLSALPDTLQLLAGSLAAGYSLPQAMDTVVREGQASIAAEFRRALTETRLGVPVEDALEAIATRTASTDFSWVVMAIRIQREVGGNLAEVLTTVAATLREREQLRRQVHALSTDGRLSGWIIGALPPLFALFLVLVRPEYLQPLITSPLGLTMIAAALLLQVVGVLLMTRLVKVEV